MPNSGEAQPFSWKRAAVHVAVPFVLALVASGVVVALTRYDDPGAMGEETGRLMAPALLLALLTSYLVQTRRTISAWLCGAFALVVFAGAVATPVLERMRAHPVALHSSDTQPLELVDIGGEPHFKHPYLQFSFKQPHPGFGPHADAQASARSFVPHDDSIHVYALAETWPGSVVLVTLQKANRIDREQLEGFVRGLSRFKEHHGDDAREIENRIIWEPSFHGARMHVVIAETNHFRLYATVDDFDTDAEYIVGITAMSLGEDTFADLAATFRAR